MAYTALAIAVYSGDMDEAAVALLTMGAGHIAREEGLPHLQAPAHAQKETRRPARQHQRL